MGPERWRQVEAIYESALNKAEPTERSAYLYSACGADQELRREVDSLLACADKADGFLEIPAAALVEPAASSAGATLKLAGRSVSHYRILEKLGEGGMGAVYRAYDDQLRRPVALKVLPPEYAADPERRHRLLREARAASALSHPNIVAIHEVGSDNGVDFIAMELVEGKTLAALIPAKGLPLVKALDYAVQIAGGLAKAHATGVIHRDLKPGNIMVTPDGLVKVLDFGRARRVTLEPGLETTLTVEGEIAGTPEYMSPEQVEGKELDARSDVFSFGVVVYEMLTGRRAFGGDSAASALAAVLREQPAPLGPKVPHDLERVVKRCMHKDRAHRFQHMDDVAVALEELKAESDEDQLAKPAAAVRKRRGWRRWVPAAVAALLLTSVLVYTLLHHSEPPSDLKPVALTSNLGIETQASFSPDGRKVAFVWDGDRQDNRDIYVKQIDSAGTPMQRTFSPAAESSPAWSPIDNWIAFVRATALVLIPTFGGPPERELIKMEGISHLSWTPDAKWILFDGRESLDDPSSIWAVSTETKECRRLTHFVTTLAVPNGRGANISYPPGDYQPSISPDGTNVAFARQIYNYVYELRVLRLTGDMRAGGEPRLVTNERYGIMRGIAWTADGRDLVYSAGGPQTEYLWRAPASGQSPPKRIPYALPAATFPAIAATRPSVLAYTYWVSNRNLWRLDTRTLERKMLITSTYEGRLPRFSADGRKIGFNSNRSGNFEVWTCDADGANCVQLTSFGGPVGGTPGWSPDGRWLALDSCLSGHPEIYVIASDGGALHRLTNCPANNVLASWSRDGRWIYFTSDRTGRYEVWKMPKDGGEPLQVTRSGGYQSVEAPPDGKYVYYVKANEPGLFRMPREGGEEVQVLPDKLNFGNWGVTAKGVYFIPETLRTIDKLEIATGKKSTLATLDQPGSHLTVCPDDSCVVWGQVDRNAQDLMLVEKFR